MVASEFYHVTNLANATAIAGFWTKIATFRLAVSVASSILQRVVARTERDFQYLAILSRVIAKARAGGITSCEMQREVITLTNLGAYEIDSFTPILNYPEIAILGLGAIRTEPVFVADPTAVGGKRVEARDRMVLS